MPVFSFTDIPDADDFSPIPPGKYLARYEHKETTSDNGIEKWAYSMVILSGQYAGRKVQDSIKWPHPQLAKADEKKMKMLQRTKLVLSRLGLDMAQGGNVNYLPEHLEGRRSVITVQNKPIENQSTGEVSIFNTIPFAGYERPEQASAPPAAASAPPATHSQTAAPPAQAAPPAAALATGPASTGVIQQPDFSLDDIPF